MTQPPYQPGQWPQQPGYPTPPAAAPKAKRRKWPWIVAAPFVLFIVLGIVAVSTSSGRDGVNAGLNAAAASSTPTTAAPVAQPADDTANAVFVASVKSHNIPFDTPEHLIRLAHMNCESFGKGDKLLDVAQATITYSATSGLAPKQWAPEQAGFEIGAAVVAYCPQYADRMTS